MENSKWKWRELGTKEYKTIVQQLSVETDNNFFLLIQPKRVRTWSDLGALYSICLH